MLELTKTAENPPVFSDETLHAVFNEKKPLDSINAGIKFARRYFVGTSKIEKENRIEDDYALGMENWSRRINAIIQVSQLFVPTEKDAVPGRSISEESIANLRTASSLALTLAKLMRQYDFRFLNGSVEVQFNLDIAKLTEYMQTECMKLLGATHKIILQQEKDTETAAQRGDCSPYRLAYAHALEKTYGWQAIHGEFVADVTLSELTEAYVADQAEFARTVSGFNLNYAAKMWLAGVIKKSALFFEMNAGFLDMQGDYVIPQKLFSIKTTDLIAYDDGVLLFIYRLTLAYDNFTK